MTSVSLFITFLKVSQVNFFFFLIVKLLKIYGVFFDIMQISKSLEIFSKKI